MRRYREALIAAGATAAGTGDRSDSRVMGAAEMDQLAERMASAYFRNDGEDDPVRNLKNDLNRATLGTNGGYETVHSTQRR